MAGLDEKHSDPARSWFSGGVRLFVLLMFVAIAVPVWTSTRTRGVHSKCAENLKRIGVAFMMYSYEERHNGGLYPNLADSRGQMMFESSRIFPKFLPDPAIGLCPRDADVIANPAAIDDWSYFYLGYMVRSDEDMERYFAAYRTAMDANCIMNRDIDFPDDPYRTRTLFRLREGVERYITVVSGDQVYVPAKADAGLAHEIPVLIERVGNHPPPWYVRFAAYLGLVEPKQGVHVLYLSGHVEYIEAPGKWPLTEKTIRILYELDAIGRHPCSMC